MTPTPPKALLPCPFCNGTKLNVCATEFHDHEVYAVSCATVACHGGIWALGNGYFKSPDEAITAWNTRAAQPVSVAPDDEALILKVVRTAVSVGRDREKRGNGRAHGDLEEALWQVDQALRRRIAGLRYEAEVWRNKAETRGREGAEARAALAACMAGKVPEGSVVLPKQAIEALYMRLWARHEHLDDGPPDFEPVRQPWTPDDDAALKAVAKYLFAAPEAPR